MTFVCIKEYNGKTLAAKRVDIPIGSKVECRGNYLYWENIPLCTNRSSVAKEYFIWDDNLERRVMYQNIIFDPNRLRKWIVPTPRTDDEGREVGVENIMTYGRYSPTEVKYIQQHWSHLVINGSTLVFNDTFYCGSDIEDLAKLAQYCKETH